MNQLSNEIQLDYSDVLISPRTSTINSRKDVQIVNSFGFRTGIPIINANMSTVGNFAVAREMLKSGCYASIHKHYSIEEICKFMDECMEYNWQTRLFMTIGLQEADFEKLEQVYHYVKSFGVHMFNVCVDAPNGYIPNMKKTVKRVRDLISEDIFIMAGNVVSGSGCYDLAEAGANIIKVGIGPGSSCNTRKITGVGRPQLSAVMACVQSLGDRNVYICADGGITCAGDVCKALVAGARFVMCGGIYAGCPESEGEIVENPITREVSKIYYGMASKHAQDLHYGGMNTYRASEGRVLEVKLTGPVKDINAEIAGGIRSCMTYIDAHTIEEMPLKGYFYRVNNQLNMMHGAGK